MNGDKVSKALTELAAAMRDEGLARLTYVGTCFEAEASDLIRVKSLKRQIFEEALQTYVERLVRA